MGGDAAGGNISRWTSGPLAGKFPAGQAASLSSSGIDYLGKSKYIQVGKQIMSLIMEEETSNQPVERPAGTHRGLGSEDKIFASLSYISILFIVPLILRHDQDEVYFHARQGMVLFGAEIVVWFILFILDSFLVILLPSLGVSVTSILGAIAWVVFVAVSLMAIYFVFSGRKWEIPLLGRIAKKIEV